jgi:hypothetical protein
VTFDEIVSEAMGRLNLQSTEAQLRIGRAVNARYKRLTSAIGLAVSRRTSVDVSPTLGATTVVVEGLEKAISVLDLTGGQRRLLAEFTVAELRDRPLSSGIPQAWAAERMSAHSVTLRLDTIVQTALTLRVFGHERAAVLTGTQEPAFPESFHDVLIEGVLTDELRKQEKTQLAAFADQTYERRLSDLRMWIAKSSYLVIRQGGRTAPIAGGGAAGGSGGGGGGGGGTGSYTQTGLVTFDRDPGPPFAVTAGSATVANLDADKLDGESGAAYHDAALLTGQMTSLARLPTLAPSRLLGRGSAGSGSPVEVLLGSNLVMSGDTLHATGGGGSGVILAENRLAGRAPGVGSGPAQEIVLGTALALAGTTLNVSDAALNETYTGLKTFSRSPAPPFAVTAGSAAVANLDADKLDGIDSTTFARKDQANTFTASPQTMPGLQLTDDSIYRSVSDQSVVVWGGAVGSTAFVQVCGPGKVGFANVVRVGLPNVAGSVFRVENLTTSAVYLRTAADYTQLLGPLYLGGVGGGGLVTVAEPGTIARNTGDGGDTGFLLVTGGGDPGVSSVRDRGAAIRLYGNEHASTGVLQLLCGNVAGSKIDLYRADSVVAVSVAGSTGDVTFSNSLLCGSNTTQRMTTDSGVLQLAGGSGWARANGAFLQVYGTTSSGLGSLHLNLGASDSANFIVYDAYGRAALLFRGVSGSIDFTSVATGAASWQFSNTSTNGGYTQYINGGSTSGWIGSAAVLISTSFVNACLCVRAASKLVLKSDIAEVLAPDVYNSTIGVSANVNVDNTGLLRRFSSTRRHKRAIEPLLDWQWLLALEPVSYAHIGDGGQRRVGFVAEDVAAVDARFVTCDADGQPDGVTYAQLTAPLVAAIQALHARLAALEGRPDGAH